MLSTSRSNPVLTENQADTLRELEKKETVTERQKQELARLLILKENSKKVILSDTCIGYLLDEYSWITRGMVRVTRELLDIPQMQKGKIVEPESLALLSLVDGVEYKANVNENKERERVYNDFLSGEVDAWYGASIMEAEIIPDIKSTWDYPTFLLKIVEPMTKDNDWQVKGYMDISFAPVGFIANCLVSASEEEINKMKFRLLNKLNVATEEAPEFKYKWNLIEHSMRFDEIPIHQRVHKTYVNPMTTHERLMVYDRVKVCREWLWKFHEKYESLNLTPAEIPTFDAKV
jgi:hypothetical protein